MSLTNKGRATLALAAVVPVVWIGNLLGADQVDGDTGQPVHKFSVVQERKVPAKTVLVHVAGREIGYEAHEDTAWCQEPSVELSYTSNADGSATIECSVPLIPNKKG